MSKIFKYSNVNIEEDRVNISVPIVHFNDNLEKSIDLNNEESFEMHKEQAAAKESETHSKKLEEIISEARLEAEQIIEDARAQALTILSEASAQAQHDRYDELRAGKLEGYEKGYREAKEEAQALLYEANKTIENAKKERKKLVDDLEPEIVDLIVKLIEKVTLGGLKINPQIILTLVKEGITGNNNTGDILVYVSEADYENVNKNITSMLDTSDKSKNIEVCKDTNMTMGDCVINTSFGNIDCSIEPQLKELKESLYYILENR